MTSRIRTPRITLATIAALVCALFLGLSVAAAATAPTASAAAVMARAGSRGWAVVVVQRVVGTAADGIYGAQTAAAVKVWQRAHQLPATGVVDSTTWARILAAWVRIPATGGDVSWPQCPPSTGHGYGLPMPNTSARLVVIGTTSGPGFTPNPCLASQTSWAKARHLYTAAYAMTTYPTASQYAAYRGRGPYSTATFTGRLNNVGFAQARFNVASLRRVGLASPIVWVDVEPYRPGWSTNKAANKAIIDGARYGYTSAGYKVGFYSTKALWFDILGTTRYRLPEWRTAGPASQNTARARCASTYSFQGGAAALGQWWGPKNDYDITCPAANTSTLLATYFHKY
jgi:peptidoglycan hydrolase-like protein with peptidoglycan-binding domain